MALDQIVIIEKPGSHWWRLLTAPFIYSNTGYAFVTLGAIALYGWLLERRHGPLPVLALFAIGGVGGAAATAAIYASPVALGANGAALALLIAWAIPDLLALRRRRGDRRRPARDGGDRGRGRADAAGRPYPGASWISDGVGVLGGVVDRAAAGAHAGRFQRTLIVPGGPSTSGRSPLRGPPMRGSGATAASSPPEVIASHTSQRRASRPTRRRS